jgi:hypothetical protein
LTRYPRKAGSVAFMLASEFHQVIGRFGSVWYYQPGFEKS